MTEPQEPRRLPPGARNTDPPTSHKAAAANKRAKATHRYKLLVAVHQDFLGNGHGLTVDEATRVAGLPDVHQRWSDLIDLGAIEPVRDVRGALVDRASDRRSDERVCTITGYGIHAIANPMLISGDPKKRISLIDSQIRDCSCVEDVRRLWRFYGANGNLTVVLQHKLRRRARELLEG